MINKKVILIFVLVLMCGLMTGCFRGVYRIDMNKDGSADLEYQLAVLPVLADKLNEAKINMKNDGFTIVEKQEGDWQGFQAKKHLVKAEELHSTGIFSSNGEKVDHPSAAPVDGLLFEHGWFQDSYSFNSTIDLRNYSKEMANAGQGIEKMIMSQLQLKLIVNLPVQPESHNASSVENEGRHLEWNLVFGQNNQIQATAKVWNQGHIVITAIMAIIAIGFIIFVWRKNRLAKNGEATPINKKVIISASVVYLILITGIAGYHFYTKANTLTTPAVKPVNLQSQVGVDTNAKSKDFKEKAENILPNDAISNNSATQDNSDIAKFYGKWYMNGPTMAESGSIEITDQEVIRIPLHDVDRIPKNTWKRNAYTVSSINVNPSTGEGYAILKFNDGSMNRFTLHSANAMTWDKAKYTWKKQ